MIGTFALVVGSAGTGFVVGACLGVIGAYRVAARAGGRLTNAAHLARDIRDLEKRRATSDLGRYLEPAGAAADRPRIRLQAAVTRPSKLSYLRSL